MVTGTVIRLKRSRSISRTSVVESGSAGPCAVAPVRLAASKAAAATIGCQLMAFSRAERRCSAPTQDITRYRHYQAEGSTRPAEASALVFGAPAVRLRRGASRARRGRATQDNSCRRARSEAATAASLRDPPARVRPGRRRLPCRHWRKGLEQARTPCCATKDRVARETG